MAIQQGALIDRMKGIPLNVGKDWKDSFHHGRHSLLQFVRRQSTEISCDNLIRLDGSDYLGKILDK